MTLTNERKREILLLSVDDYIRSAQPITSNALQTHFPNLSTATLRNELNALDAMGYLGQLHTSSGRVPTDLAYKFYVNEILSKNDLNFKKLERVKKDYENKSLSIVTTLTSLAKQLSTATNYPTVLVQYGLENLKINNIQIIPLIQKDALLLIETESGIIDNNIPIDACDKSSCVETSQLLSSEFAGKTIKYLMDNIKNVCLKAGSQIISLNKLIDNIISALHKVIKKKIDISAGNPSKMLSNITQDEYDQAKEIMSFLSDDHKVMEAFDEEFVEGMSVKLGEEDLKSGMMLIAPIKIHGVPIASLSLVGPKRVDYRTLASALKFIVSQAEDLK